MSSIKSPCIKKCSMIEGNCTGCLRTSDEIKNWGLMEDEEKVSVKKELKERRRKLKEDLNK